MIGYTTVILLSWAAFIAVWVVLAFQVKRDIRGSRASLWFLRGMLLRILIVGAVALVVAFFARNSVHYGGIPSEFQSLFLVSPLLGWIGAVLSVLGIGIAIWARLYLGRNWSGAPAIKEDHQLVTSV